MSWQLLTILAVFIFAVTTILDKFLLTKWIKNPFVPPLFFGPLGLLTSFVIYLFYGFSFLSLQNVVLALFAGFIYMAGEFLYYKAVNVEEVSRVIPLIYLSPLFVLILAAIFLNETLTPVKYLGVFLMTAGAFFISSGKLAPTPNFGVGAFWFAVLSALMFAFVGIITKYLLNVADFWTVFAYVRMGAFITSLTGFYFYFKDFKPLIEARNFKITGLLIFNALLLLFGILLLTQATATGSVTLVGALTSFQPFFTFLLATLSTIFFPSIVKERIERSLIVQKILAITFIVAGSALAV